MLEKIIRVDNVGVFKAGVPSAVTLKKVTVVYADNARGKSTLSALLRACGAGDAQAIQARKTIGATGNQAVHLRFQTSGGGSTISFDGNAWSAAAPNLHVFNQEFVERNVYAGAAVTPDQRASLLELALGADAVVQREEFQKQSDAQRGATQKVTATETALQGYHRGTTLAAFLDLQPVADGPQLLAKLDKQLNEARSVQQILGRQGFRLLSALVYNFDNIRTILESHFERLQEDAEAAVRKHFDAHLGRETERWVNEGLHHKPEEHCPFCGQETAGLALLQAYKDYFNQAYKEHLQRVASLQGLADHQVSGVLVHEWRATIDFNTGAQEGWSGLLRLDLPVFSMDAAHEEIDKARAIVNVLVAEKTAKPLESVDVGPLEQAATILQEISDNVARHNDAIQALNEEVTKYKNGLAQSDTAALQAQRRLIELRMVRNAPEVTQHLAERTKAEGERQEAERKKLAARKKLDQLMTESLATFQEAINARLRDFGAPFSIRELKPNYMGGGVPRSEYVLEVRGALVPVGPANGGALTFHTVLSEGDKRTLAFALFLARLFADPDRAQAVVVLDDVFTSLDLHRRAKTVETALAISLECKQIIALGHDAYFLRDIQKRVTKVGGEVVSLELRRGPENFTVIDQFDLDEFCASPYYKRYRRVEMYMTGAAQVNMLEVAQALRLLVEGHLHRCFLGRFAEGQTVGAMIQLIKDAQTSNPIHMLQPLVPELLAFNEYAAMFHHDTSGGHTRTDVNDGELYHFASAALRFIQIGKLF
ncbi:wobble nucleotide-excising tRNase [Paraburkholderia sp. BL18I3N2]|uniref:AAA family ATPase n=1 Tax=Paraburkholderia sp. BL18I3N2 TaxID=1938799 RepID=UPI000D07AB2C|nr:AAA family ATPase [Paraburkholderia sp. BL18I3N2]PRX27791.1 wobble nucleotide-excising tRNase [Paraburkholderia sp. BL18I3N2]